MGVCFGEIFDGGGNATVRVALAQDGVDCAAEGVGVLGLNGRFGFILGVGGVIGQGLAVCLQFFNRRL